MPVVTETVKRPVHETALPDALSAPAQLLAELNGSGVLQMLGRALPVSRKGGYTGGPLVSFAIAYLVAKTGLGLRPFWSTYKRHLKRVAAVAGYILFPSSGSVSRAMGKVQEDMAHAFADAALSACPDLARLLSHPSVVHRDSRGKALHVIDIDPTVQAFRLRDLIEDDDHPEAERLAPGVPGYTGHHRGEVRIRHIAVCHAGAGAWLAYRVSDNNPRLSELFSSVLRPAIGVMAKANVSADQILVRGDAEFGSAGVAKAIVDLRVQLLVRISRYRLLDRPEVLQTLQHAMWEEVSSGGIRLREATDLGWMMLHPSSKSADADTAGISLRVVVVRRKVESSTVPYGTLRDGYQYELMATTLSADDWSAADIVELYGGRSAIENRFAQEDRELQLGRTFSYNPAGQAVFTAIGLYLWNHWTCAGFLASPPSEIVHQPTPRQRVPSPPTETPAADLQPVQPPAVQTTIEPSAPTVVPEPAEPVLTDLAHQTRDPMDPFPRAAAAEREPLVALLRSAYQDLLQVPGWSLDSAALLRCPNDKRLFPFSLGSVGLGRPKPQVIIRTDVGACDGCPVRAGCFASTRPNMYKQVSRAISAEEVEILVPFLARHPPGRKLPKSPPRPRTPRPKPEPPPHFPVDEIVRSPPASAIGPWEWTAPTFPAAAARQLARRQHANVRVEIHISRRRRPGSQPPDLRRTRKTWNWRERKWQLDAFVRLVRNIPHHPPKKRSVSQA